MLLLKIMLSYSNSHPNNFPSEECLTIPVTSHSFKRLKCTMKTELLKIGGTLPFSVCCLIKLQLSTLWSKEVLLIIHTCWVRISLLEACCTVLIKENMYLSPSHESAHSVCIYRINLPWRNTRLEINNGVTAVSVVTEWLNTFFFSRRVH